MMDILSLIKVIAEKLNVTVLVVSVLSTTLYYKFQSTETAGCVIVFCITYLFAEITKHLYNKSVEWQANARRRKVKRMESQRDLQERSERIWQHFLSLDASALKLSVALYLQPQVDSSNPYLRVIAISQADYHMFYHNSPFDISVGYNCYISCLSVEMKATKAVVIFDEYFYALVENYAKTGKKEKNV